MKKQQPPRNKSKNNWWALLLILGIAIAISHFASVEDESLKQCPRDVSGPEQPKMLIQYFDSPYCFYCHIQKGSLDNIAREFNESIRIEKYDIRYCSEFAKDYSIGATPGFVFQVGDVRKVHMGLISKEHMQQIACDVTKKC